VTATDNLARLRQWVDSVNRGTPAFGETFAPEATIEIVGGPPDAAIARLRQFDDSSPCCVSGSAVHCG
jgi:hypothetical protein